MIKVCDFSHLPLSAPLLYSEGPVRYVPNGLVFLYKTYYSDRLYGDEVGPMMVWAPAAAKQLAAVPMRFCNAAEISYILYKDCIKKLWRRLMAAP